MNDEIIRAAEAILLVAERPLETELLASVLELKESEAELLCQELAERYAAAGHGFVLCRVAGGWRFQTHADAAPWVERYVLEGQTSRLSSAALETLAIVAYKQPLSRAQIAAIRGVNVDGVVRTLLQREYLGEVGRDPGPGQAVLYGTTPEFLEKVGLDRIDQLPALADFVPGADVVEALEKGLRSGLGGSEPEVSGADAEAAPAASDPNESDAASDAKPAVDIDLTDERHLTDDAAAVSTDGSGDIATEVVADVVSDVDGATSTPGGAADESAADETEADAPDLASSIEVEAIEQSEDDTTVEDDIVIDLTDDTTVGSGDGNDA